MSNLLEFLSRVLLSVLFLISSVWKVMEFTETQRYMELQGVADWLLPVVIAAEIVLPIMVMVGWHTRLAAVALGVFTVLTALLFHIEFTDQIQFTMFMKNVAIAGGFFLLAVHGAGAWSIDYNKRQNHFH